MNRTKAAMLGLTITLAASAVAFATELDPAQATLPHAPPPSPELMARPSPPKPSSDMHPRLVLRDAEAKPVRDSGAAIDVKNTCAPCHDVAWIAAHGFHFANSASAPSVLVTGSTPTSTAPNCFFCHVRRAAFELARATLKAGNSPWVATATLANTELVMSANAVENAPFVYAKEAFASDGSVSADQLGLGPPSNDACGACHGLVSRQSPKLADWLQRPRLTEQTGQVFSPERVSASTLNLKDREHLTRPWDVHAERLLGCSDCHFVANDPRSRALSQSVPETLRFEPRHAGIGAFLRRPDHDFARGERQVRCENCHDARPLHEFLPHTERHLARVGCEVCHVPRSLVPALREVDASLPTAPGQPRLSYRGIEGSLEEPSGTITGFEPYVIPRSDARGNSKLTAVNFVTTWDWREGSGSRVEDAVVNRALFDSAGRLKREIIAALDLNHDGQLRDREWLLDTDARVRAVAGVLARAGVREPKRVGEVRAIPIRHGIVGGKSALRDCTSCHARDSRLSRPGIVAQAVAPSSTLKYAGDTAEISLAIEPMQASALAVARSGARQRSDYVFGASRTPWLDTAGISVASLVLLGALAHGGMRVRATQRRRRRSR